MHSRSYILCIVIMLISSTSLAQWEATITATKEDSPTMESVVTFGLHPSASDGFDAEYDIPFPPPGIVELYVAFEIDGVIRYLSKDIKHQAYPKQWSLYIYLRKGSVDLTWDISSIPSDKFVFLDNGSETVDMRSGDSLSLAHGHHSLTLTVTENTPPVADSQSVNTDEDTPVAISLIANDVDRDTLTYTIVDAPSNGFLTGTAPNLIYTPDANFNGSDSFTFKVNDGTSDSNIATVTITVNPVNDPPVAYSQSVITDEDIPVAITLIANDVDRDTLTYTIVDAPSNGSLTGTAPNLTYTPDANFNGSDSFTFKVNDGTVDSNTAAVSILVGSVNDPPVADSQSVNTDEDTPVAITLTGSDVEGSPLTYAVVGAPSNGSLTGTAPGLTYTPDANFNGSDSFTFKVNDGTSDSRIATVSIIVDPVNDPPVADSQSVTTGEDTPVAITLIANDVDRDTFTYTIVDTPSNGSLTGTAPNLTYMPDANFNGSDSFTFKVNDGTSDSNIATVSITVDPCEDSPVADSQSITTDEDTPVDITLIGSDADGDQLTYAVINGTSNGSVTGTAPNLTYTPDANFNGSDSFTFEVNDGTSDSNIATVSITVSPVNDPPVADSQSVTTGEDTPVAITLTGSDIEGSLLTYDVVDAPSNGFLTGTAPNLTYMPDANFNGSDSFTFKVNDGTSDSNIATVSITVDPCEDSPVADSQSITTDEDTPVAITLIGSDADGDQLTYAVINGTSNGFLTGTAPNLTYTPDANFNGSDSFTFKVNDGTSDSNIATVSITVSPVNDPPVAYGLSVITDEDYFATINLSGADTEGDWLTYVIVNEPSSGAVVDLAEVSPTLSGLGYIPDSNFNGSDSFTFKASDGASDSNIATVSITVNPVNDPPVAYSQSITTATNIPLTIALTASDVEADPLTYSTVDGPSNGSLSGMAPNLVYMPDYDFKGSDSFSFKANDGSVDSNIAVVSIAVDDNLDNLIGGLSVMCLCPVDMVVVDRDGRAISKDICTIPSASYTEEDLNEDGDLDDVVAIPDASTGIYSIEIVPEPGADPSETYTLRVIYGNMSKTLAENVEVRDIPVEPYSFFFPLREMSAGWNLISLPVEPLDTNIDSVLSSIQGRYDSVWRYDTLQGWFCYLPDASGTSSFWRMGTDIGYWVMMKESSQLFIRSEGLPVAQFTQLYQGWNVVGYNSLVSKAIEDCMSSIQGKFASIWSYDPNQGWLWYTPDAPERSTLRSMDPGNGYLIEATEDFTWDIN